MLPEREARSKLYEACAKFKHPRLAYALTLLSVVQALAILHPNKTPDAATLKRDALQGDYDSQRSLAGLYEAGYFGFPQDFAAACMWRTTIVRSGDPQVDRSDASNRDQVCAKVPSAQRVAAEREGDALARKIAGTNATLVKGAVPSAQP
jgi:hypothetical protein